MDPNTTERTFLFPPVVSILRYNTNFQSHMISTTAWKQFYNITTTLNANVDVVFLLKKSSHIGHDCFIDAGQLIICSGKQLTAILDDCLFFSFIPFNVVHLLPLLSGFI